ncbi:MAG: glycosyl hydrolase family 28-related protein, partial [Pyrinomonadaceae bacterium]
MSYQFWDICAAVSARTVVSRRFGRRLFALLIVSLMAGVGAVLTKGQSPTTGPLSQQGTGINIKSLGARGDGQTDDTAAIRSAVAAAGKSGGGRVVIPPGTFRITAPIDLPSGVIIEGSGSAYNGFCQLLLTVPNQKVFTIGEGRRNIKIHDLEIKAQYASTSPFRLMAGTIAIAAEGRNLNQPTIDVEFRGLTITGFDKGISVEGSSAQGQWQFDHILVDHCSFYDGRVGIYLNSVNSTFWKITHCNIGVLAGGYAIYINRSGPVTIDTTLSSGPVGYSPSRPETMARAFVYLGGGQSTVTIINGFGEGVENFLEVAGQGTYTLPITVMGSLIGSKVLFHENVQYISIGNSYNAGSVQTVDRATDVVIQSIGDVAQDPPYSGNVPNGGASPFKLIGNSRVAFSSGLFAASFNAPTMFAQTVAIGAKPTPDVLLSLLAPNNNQIHLRIGNTDGFYYNIFRDPTDGYLSFIGNQKGYAGYRFNGDIVPQTDRQGNIGTANKKWASVRAVVVTSGDTILSDKGTGEELYKIHEDQNNIYFDDIRTGKRLMRLDREGNLHVAGKVIE